MANFRPLDAFLTSDDAVNRLAAQAGLLLRLRETAPLVLPDQLARSSSIASYRQGKVIIFAENNAIAAKLRLFEPRLTEIWARQGMQVSAIRVEVQPGKTQIAPKTKHANLSPAAKQALTGLESTLPSDSPLRGAIHALAGRGRDVPSGTKE